MQFVNRMRWIVLVIQCCRQSCSRDIRSSFSFPHSWPFVAEIESRLRRYRGTFYIAVWLAVAAQVDTSQQELKQQVSKQGSRSRLGLVNGFDLIEDL